MRKMLLALLVIFLLGTCLVGCGDSNTGKSATVCVGSVTIAGGLAWAGVVDIPFVLSALPNCIEFVYDLFASSSPHTSRLAADVLNSFPAHARADTSKVTLSDKYTYTSAVSSRVYSLTLANCIPLPFNPTLAYQIPYSLSVHSTMGVGEKNDLKLFTAKTGELSSFGSVNRTLFDHYDLSSQPGQTSNVNMSIPAHKKMAVNVFTTIGYKYGVARVEDNGTTSYLPWLVTTSSKPTVRVQTELQSC